MLRARREPLGIVGTVVSQSAVWRLTGGLSEWWVLWEFEQLKQAFCMISWTMQTCCPDFKVLNKILTAASDILIGQVRDGVHLLFFP